MLRKLIRRILVGKPDPRPGYVVFAENLRKQGAVIGENSYFHNCVIDTLYPWLIEVGRNSTITNSSIFTHDSSLYHVLGYRKIGRVVIGNDCFIGGGCIILPGTSIGDRTVIGAGCVITGNVPGDSVYVSGGEHGHLVRLMSFSEFVQKHRSKIESGDVLVCARPDDGSVLEEREKILAELKGKGGCGYIDVAHF